MKKVLFSILTAVVMTLSSLTGYAADSVTLEGVSGSALPGGVMTETAELFAADTNLALGKTASGSAEVFSGHDYGAIVDGNMTTRLAMKDYVNYKRKFLRIADRF